MYVLVIGVVMLQACGPSKEEIAQREKFVADSMAVVKLHEQNLAAGLDGNKMKLNEALENAIKSLKIQKAKLKKMRNS